MFALFRQYDPAMTRVQLDGIALASGAALQTYTFRGESQPVSGDHGINWVRSYWEQGGEWGMCIFEAPSLAVLANFQELCGTPFIDAMQVEELTNSESAPQHVLAANLRITPESADPGAEVDEVKAQLGQGAKGLLRAYANGMRGMAVALLEPGVSLPGEVRTIPVVEILPSEYQ